MSTKIEVRHTRLYWHQLTRKAGNLTELTQLSHQVQRDPQLPPEQQAALLGAIQQQIWLRSVADFDGCG